MLAPKTLKDLFEKYKQKRISFDKQHKNLDKENGNNNFIETSIFEHLGFNIFIFIMAIISVIIMFIVIKLIFKRRENASVGSKFGNNKRCKSPK